MKKRHGITCVGIAVFFILAVLGAASAEDRFAFVTSEGGNNLSIIDLRAEKTVKTLPTGKIPHVVVFSKEGKGYVNNRGTKDLTVIDGGSFEVIRTVPLPATSFQLALSPDGKKLAIAYKDALKLTLLDTSRDTILRTIEIGKEPAGEFKGAMMRHSFWSRDGRYVYLSDDVHNAIVKVDADSGEIKATVPMPGPNHYLHPSPDGMVLYGVNETTKSGTSVTVIDLASDTVIKDISIPLDAGERGLGHHGEFSRDGKYFFSCSEGGQTVAVIDTGKREVVRTLKVGMGPGHPVMTRDGKELFVIHHRDNVVAVIDTETHEVVKIISVGTGRKQAHSGYMTPDGKYFYMINAEDNQMVRIDVAKKEVVSKVPVGPSAMFFSIKEGSDFPSTE